MAKRLQEAAKAQESGRPAWYHSSHAYPSLITSPFCHLRWKLREASVLAVGATAELLINSSQGFNHDQFMSAVLLTDLKTPNGRRTTYSLDFPLGEVLTGVLAIYTQCRHSFVVGLYGVHHSSVMLSPLKSRCHSFRPLLPLYKRHRTLCLSRSVPAERLRTTAQRYVHE